ncbi:MAG: transcriptional repressor [Bacteroidetes bacterium]|nr:transcriptional repressor [Bacteroidota bacterium]MCY4225254.1 transcriptional repressor [Bacteroidota bacterium]
MRKLSITQLNEIRDHFRTFLKNQGLRETRERLLILESIYDAHGHLDADEMHHILREQGHAVSRATVYNTLNLLLKCDLVVRHQFGNAPAKYEPSYLFGQHDHLICLDCQKVMEFCDPRIQSIQDMVADTYSFEIKRHALNLYGHCNREECVNRSAPQPTT